MGKVGGQQCASSLDHLNKAIAKPLLACMLHKRREKQLGDGYYRIQPMLPEDVDLADAGKVPLLLAVADGYDLDEAADWIKTTWSS